MKINVVYVLISDGNDDFCEMTLLSLHSLRHHNPQASVYILTDNSSFQVFTSNYGPSPMGATILVTSIPEGLEKKKRSRYLKTSLRKHISGDFLFIDCDTMICSSLEDLASFDCTLGCVPDFHTQTRLNRPEMISQCEENGFNNLNGKPYYNSGVIFAKDTPLCAEFFSEWHRLWLVSSTKGNMLDQPAFCQANVNLGFPVHEIPGEWNCMIQFKEGRDLLHRAKIIHYFSSPAFVSTPRRVLFDSIKRSRCIDPSLDNLVRNPQTIGFATFSSDIGTGIFFNRFLFSDLLYVYCFIHPLFQFILKVTKLLSKPALFIIRIKNHITKKFQNYYMK